MELNLKGPIAIIGFGTEGKAALKFLVKQGITDITICDQAIDLEMPAGYPHQRGPDYLKGLNRFPTIIRSPGVPYHLPEIQAAKKAGSRLTSMTWLTLEAASERITAVTGSNGKTTTVTLAGEILKRHYGPRLIVGGNDRTPILHEAITRPRDPILIEASSFQFIDLTISPYIAAILNITPNHLDWHANLQEYILAKENIIRHQNATDWAILNLEDENTARLANDGIEQLFALGKKVGDNWAIWQDDHLMVSFAGQSETLLTKNELQVKTHPLNLLCAAAIGILHQVPYEQIRLAMTQFKGLEDRLELVRRMSSSNISFYNDSSCTTPESVYVAIDNFPAVQLILLLGGSSKKGDFSELAQMITEKGIRVGLYGVEGQVIEKALHNCGGSEFILFREQTGDFQKVIEAAYKAAKPGDSIVLSPACASFDMFKNAKERGKLFNQIVNEL